jgi:hypothetical protein
MTHSSSRTLAAEVAVSDATVLRVWRKHVLKLHRILTFRVSRGLRSFALALPAMISDLTPDTSAKRFQARMIRRGGFDAVQPLAGLGKQR